MAPAKTDKEREKDAQHLKRMLTMARKGPINFGIALGKANENLAFLAHQRKNPKSLRKQAREETGNSKGAHGEMTVDGKDLVFVCQDTPPGPLVKAMRLFLKDLKVPLRAEFRVPDEAAGPAKAAPADAADAADGARGAEAAPAEAAPAEAADDAAARRAPAAREAEPASDGEIDAAREQWNRRHEKARLATVKVLKTGLGDPDKIRAVLSFAQGKAETSDYAAALRALNSLDKLLVRAIKDKAGGGKDDIAAGIVEKRKFLITRWQKVPAEVKVELGNLKTAIAVNVPDEDPDELCGAIETSLDELIGEIQSAIDASIGAGDPGYATALKTIEQQKQKVQNHEILQLLKKTPLISGERFEASVFSALDEVRDALAA